MHPSWSSEPTDSWARMSPANSSPPAPTCARWSAQRRQYPQHRRSRCHPLSRRRLRHRHRARGDGGLRPGVLLRGRHPGVAAGPGAAVSHQRRGTAQRSRRRGGTNPFAATLKRFVFTSSYATVGRRHGHVASEDDQIDRRGLTPYVESRVQAEDMVLRYAADKGLPAVAMCVSTTYGSGDWGRTPHGAFIAGAVYGKLPFLMNGIQLEVVGVDDAARAMLLAAERGRDRRALPDLGADDPAQRGRHDRGRRGRCAGAAAGDLGAGAVRRWGCWAACGRG